jgi:hypothetical protein
MLLPRKTPLAARVRRETLRAVPIEEAARHRLTGCSWDTSLGQTETRTFVGPRLENNKASTTTRANRALQTGMFPRRHPLGRWVNKGTALSMRKLFDLKHV